MCYLYIRCYISNNLNLAGMSASRILTLLLLTLAACSPKVVTKTVTDTITIERTQIVEANHTDSWQSIMGADSIVYAERTDTIATTKYVKVYKPSKTETKVVHDTITIHDNTTTQATHNENVKEQPKPSAIETWVGVILFVLGMGWLCWSVVKDMKKH